MAVNSLVKNRARLSLALALACARVLSRTKVPYASIRAGLVIASGFKH